MQLKLSETEVTEIVAALMAVEPSGGGSVTHTIRRSIMTRTGMTEDGEQDLYDRVAQMRATVLREIADEVVS